jgi:hypothetical protein
VGVQVPYGHHVQFTPPALPQVRLFLSVRRMAVIVAMVVATLEIGIKALDLDSKAMLLDISGMKIGI